jgi:molybdopterin-containing oxidoreductase family membrane subunit
MADIPAQTSTYTAESEPAIIGPGHTFASVTDKISSIVLQRPAPWGWWFGLAVSFSLVMLLLYAVTYLLVVGVGVWGINIPIAWGFAIVNFVWWVGIGHAGTLISAILLLLHQEWRTSINRFAEAMTLFAVACAGLFPLLHMGRPWFAYWLLPYPNTMKVWPQPPFGVGCVCSLYLLHRFAVVLVWSIPDLATLRDKARNRFAKIAYGVRLWAGGSARTGGMRSLTLY